MVGLLSKVIQFGNDKGNIDGNDDKSEDTAVIVVAGIIGGH
jgi:hypothetical protein